MSAPVAPSTDRIAVIGDVGGHRLELVRELARLGADPVTGRLPADLVVVQVGDLVHRGPDSAGVVELVDGYLRDQPGQWVQLVGNHEAQYLREPAFDWPETLPAPAAGTLRRWWAEGQMRAAVSIASADERFLITHAGLTRGFWQQVLGGIDDPARAAAALNSFIGTHEEVLFHAGQMLGPPARSSRPGRPARSGRPTRSGPAGPDPIAGPVWAAAATELVPSWLGADLPFSQVHGHTSIAGRPGRESPASPEVLDRTVVDEAAGHETTVLAGGRIIGVDPGHSRHPRPSWRAWQLSGTLARPSR